MANAKASGTVSRATSDVQQRTTDAGSIAEFGSATHLADGLLSVAVLVLLAASGVLIGWVLLVP